MHHNIKEKLYQRSFVKIIGSWNGLVCISPWVTAVFLYNPTTGDSKRLPEVTGERYQVHAFGFDDVNDDYKVVKLDADFDDRVLYASVYSLKAGSWRRICDLDYKLLIGCFVSGVNVNGAVHWLLIGDRGQRVMLAFDLQTEKFQEMSLPVEVKGLPYLGNTFAVGNLGGRLCVNNSFHEVHDDIWVMNEYGVESSWIRIRISLLYKRMKLLCSTRNSEEFLMEVDGNMLLYNFETNAWRNLGTPGCYIIQADTYIESLISPNSYGVEN